MRSYSKRLSSKVFEMLRCGELGGMVSFEEAMAIIRENTIEHSYCTYQQRNWLGYTCKISGYGLFTSLTCEYSTSKTIREAGMLGMSSRATTFACLYPQIMYQAPQPVHANGAGQPQPAWQPGSLAARRFVPLGWLTPPGPPSFLRIASGDQLRRSAEDLFHDRDNAQTL